MEAHLASFQRAHAATPPIVFPGHRLHTTSPLHRSPSCIHSGNYPDDPEVAAPSAAGAGFSLPFSALVTASAAAFNARLGICATSSSMSSESVASFPSFMRLSPTLSVAPSLSRFPRWVDCPAGIDAGISSVGAGSVGAGTGAGTVQQALALTPRGC